jgi:protein-S-isoprenylcysteine O-methyltransferase Ste14
MTKRRALVLDVAERLAVLALYGWLVVRIATGLHAGGVVANLLILPSEGLVLVFVLLRRRTEHVSNSPCEWSIAVIATCAALLVKPSGQPLLPPAIGASVLVMGILIQTHAKLYLGRSFGCVPAHRGLVKRGPYEIVRHPMYAGYALSHLGFLLMNPTWWNLGMYAVSESLQIPRLLAEERLLGRDEDYRRYQSVVRYRLIPGLWLF